MLWRWRHLQLTWQRPLIIRLIELLMLLEDLLFDNQQEWIVDLVPRMDGQLSHLSNEMEDQNQNVALACSSLHRGVTGCLENRHLVIQKKSIII